MPISIIAVLVVSVPKCGVLYNTQSFILYEVYDAFKFLFIRVNRRENYVKIAGFCGDKIVVEIFVWYIQLKYM